MVWQISEVISDLYNCFDDRRLSFSRDIVNDRRHRRAENRNATTTTPVDVYGSVRINGVRV